jgi:hypothetical protein
MDGLFAIVQSSLRRGEWPIILVKFIQYRVPVHCKGTPKRPPEREKPGTGTTERGTHPKIIAACDT